jgi:hypothetical protein
MMGKAALAAAPRYTREKSAEHMLDALSRLVSGLPARIEPEANVEREVNSSMRGSRGTYDPRAPALGDRL